jgi:hypothetical protein
MRVVLIAIVSSLLAACATPRAADGGAPPGSGLEPAFAAVETARELKKQKTTDHALGWKVEMVAGRARWFACESADTCGPKRVDVPASSILALKVVGRAKATLEDGSTGGESDVYDITLKLDPSTTRAGSTYDSNHGLTVH